MGVVISMGSFSGGPDIWMVGVRMGTVRGANGSSFAWPSLRGILCGLRSITCAICRANGATVSITTESVEDGKAADADGRASAQLLRVKAGSGQRASG